MRTHGANVGAVVADVGAVTIQSLQDAGVDYDELHFGKPWAQFYIDDKAVNAYADMAKELGYYSPSPHKAIPSKYTSPNTKPPPAKRPSTAGHSTLTLVLAGPWRARPCRAFI